MIFMLFFYQLQFKIATILACIAGLKGQFHETCEMGWGMDISTQDSCYPLIDEHMRVWQFTQYFMKQPGIRFMGDPYGLKSVANKGDFNEKVNYQTWFI